MPGQFFKLKTENRMLKRGEAILNLDEPKTNIEKETLARIEQIKDDYKLREGNQILFVYPKVLIHKNPLNGNKVDKPASIRIQFHDIVREKTGATEWRWFETTSGSKEQGDLRYTPSQIFFTGTLSLGEERADLIFFLLDIYSHTEGGKNWSQNKAVYLAVDDKLKEASNYGKKQKAEFLIQAAIYGETIGLSDENIRILAGSVGVQNFSTLEMDILKQTTHALLMKDIDRASELINDLRKGGRNPELLALVQELKDKNIIVVNGVGKTRKWHVVEDGKPGTVIMPVVGGKPVDAQLVEFMIADTSVEAMLREKLDVLVE